MNLSVTATIKHTLKSRLLFYITVLLVKLGIQDDEWIEKRIAQIAKNMTVSIDGKTWKHLK